MFKRRYLPFSEGSKPFFVEITTMQRAEQMNKIAIEHFLPGMPTVEYADVSYGRIIGVGFLGAGMIILKNNNTVTGLTTAAGVWTTGAIGVALGYGFYFGAAVVAVLLLSSIVLLSKFEKRKKANEIIYIEIDDIYKTNDILNEIKRIFKEPFEYQVTPPKSGSQNNMGIIIIFRNTFDFNCDDLLKMDSIVFVAEDS